MLLLTFGFLFWFINRNSIKCHRLVTCIFCWFYVISLCVKGYLAARRHMEGIVNTVLMMVDSGLPCFSRGDPIGNLRKRFHPEMSEREAANFMIRTCTDAYNKWTTAGYDLIQYLQQGIEKWTNFWLKATNVHAIAFVWSTGVYIGSP